MYEKGSTVPGGDARRGCTVSVWVDVFVDMGTDNDVGVHVSNNFGFVFFSPFLNISLVSVRPLLFPSRYFRVWIRIPNVNCST